MPDEIWKDCVEFPDHYAVSNIGRVKRKPDRILNPTLTGPPGGLYLSVMPSVNGIPYRRRVHVMVLEAFVGPRPNGLVCNHKDGNKTNNTVENLEWVTYSENLWHSMNVLHNEYNRHRVMTEDKIEEATLLRSQGWPLWKIGEKFGVSKSLINKLTEKGNQLARPRGEKNHKTSLTGQNVLEIRRLYSSGQSQQAIADQFGIGQSTVSRILRREVWKHID